MRPLGKSEELEKRRRKVVDWVHGGMSKFDAAKRACTTIRSIDRWLADYTKNGSKGLASIPRHPTNNKLTNRQVKYVQELLLRGAKASGFDSDLWTCRRVAEAIFTAFGVQFHPDHMGRLLRRLGWSLQKPATKPREKNPEQIRRWVTKNWYSIKKKFKSADPPSSLSMRLAC